MLGFNTFYKGVTALLGNTRLGKMAKVADLHSALADSNLRVIRVDPIGASGQYLVQLGVTAKPLKAGTGENGLLAHFPPIAQKGQKTLILPVGEESANFAPEQTPGLVLATDESKRQFELAVNKGMVDQAIVALLHTKGIAASSCRTLEDEGDYNTRWVAITLSA